MQFRFVAWKGSDFLRLCFSSHGVSTALLRIVRLYSSFAIPLYASPFLSVGKLLCADPFQCCASPSHSYHCLSGAVPVHALPFRFRSSLSQSMPLQRKATQRNAWKSFARLLQSFPMHRISLQCPGNSDLCFSLAGRGGFMPSDAYALFPPITFPSSSSSSHSKRPLPELRHWPRPRRIP